MTQIYWIESFCQQEMPSGQHKSRAPEHTHAQSPASRYPHFMFCFKKKVVLTFPKLPLPMARRIWKWSKLTVKKAESGSQVRLASRTWCPRTTHLFCWLLSTGVNHLISAPGHWGTAQWMTSHFLPNTVKISPWVHRRRHLVGTKVGDNRKVQLFGFHIQIFNIFSFSRQSCPHYRPLPLVYPVLSQSDHSLLVPAVAVLQSSPSTQCV